MEIAMSKTLSTEKAPRKVLAYQVETNDPEESTIQFATSSAAARRQGADEIGTDFSGIASCRRAHWADRYADLRYIPAKAYIDAGWWFDCNHCGTRCNSDASRWDKETDTDIPLVLVFDGRVVYCSVECKVGHDAEVSARNAKFEAFKAAAAEAQPGVTFTGFTGGYPYCANSGKFTFPGAQYGGSVRDTEESTELTWWVCAVDKDAWDRFIDEQQAA